MKTKIGKMILKQNTNKISLLNKKLVDLALELRDIKHGFLFDNAEYREQFFTKIRNNRKAYDMLNKEIEEINFIEMFLPKEDEVSK